MNFFPSLILQIFYENFVLNYHRSDAKSSLPNPRLLARDQWLLLTDAAKHLAEAYQYSYTADCTDEHLIKVVPKSLKSTIQEVHVLPQRNWMQGGRDLLRQSLTP